MVRKRRYLSVEKDRGVALEQFHKDVKSKTEVLVAHSFFEIVCQAPEALTIQDLEQYAVRWIDRGWSADVVSNYFNNGNGSKSLRLRSYIDTLAY